MVAQIRLSRRHLLGAAVAVGGLAVSGRIARGQNTPRIEKLAPELDKIISASEPIQHLADGFGGQLGPAEGPVWWKEGRYLLFSDIHNNRRMKYEPGAGVTVFLEPTNRANGLTRDLQGRLIACEHDTRRVTRLEPDGSLTVIANSFQGRQLNRPNDVVVRSDGCIYFPDPWTNPAPQQQWDLTFAGVATLAIEKAALLGHHFGTTIDDFARHDIIDLAGLKFHAGATATYHAATDQLTAHSGHASATMTLLSPHGHHFGTATDGHGGTDVFLLHA